MRTIAAILGCCLALTLVSSPTEAHARQCAGTVNAGSHTYRSIAVHNGVTCRGARRKIRRWAHTGFPRNAVGWYCDMKSRRKLCSRGNGQAPYFTFVRRRR